jgi:hypothetical protein
MFKTIVETAYLTIIEQLADYIWNFCLRLMIDSSANKRV